MKKRFALFAAMLFAFSLANPGGALAKDDPNAFEFHVGDAFLQGLGFPPGDVAQATHDCGSNCGDTVTVIATGELRGNGKKAEGTGSFAHKNAAGATLAIGSFTAARLQSFTDLGSQTGFPATFHSGSASILVHVVAHPISDLTATVKFDGVLTIDCRLGGHPADGKTEGINFVVLNGPFAGLAFDHKVSGVNLLVAEGDNEKD